ncbi:MAG: DnaJ domain-containing protein [Ktedonobacteraceae bacterium]|nr:DnaJ domain-containing protein [Ktedonobacteraceae bacterium]
MDTPDNYYAILGIPIDADSDTLKRAYRQLARRYHPDLAGPEAAVQMKRVNRAYAVLSDPEKRLNYDTIIGGTIDLRKGGLSRPRPRSQRVDPADVDDSEFAGLSIFSTKGPLHTGPLFHSGLGVVSTLSSVQTPQGLLIAAGSLDGKGAIWSVSSKERLAAFAADPALTIESLRELRFSPAGRVLAGWGRAGLHVWDASNGNLLWSYSLTERAVSAHYSLDVVLREAQNAGHTLREAQNAGHMLQLALPLLPEDTRAPRQRGVRGTDVVTHTLGKPAGTMGETLVCLEEELEKRQFWAVRLRALARDTSTLLTLSCAHTPQSTEETIIVRRWDLTARPRFSNKARPRITSSVLAGLCADCTPPYAVTPDAAMLAFSYAGQKVRIQDTSSGTYNELASGTMGGSSRLAISDDAQWVAAAREDSEVNEGVIDLWSVAEGRIVQKLYHPWQISALHFAGQRLIVALTDGTIQVWE